MFQNPTAQIEEDNLPEDLPKYKIVVIGSGPGGYTAAIRAAQLGGKVAIIEKDLVGGICTNWGCTPSKAMITSAKYAKYINESLKYGIETNGTKVNFQKVAERRDKVMKDSRDHIKSLLEHWKVDLIQGWGEIIDDKHVKVSKDGLDQTLETENIIIATGSEPLIPGFLNKADPSIINSNALITIKDLPSELTIVGGGIIGLEFSALFSHFGTKVRIIELMDKCISMMDPEISDEIEKQLTESGVEILTGHKVLDISNGIIKVEDQKTKEVKEISSKTNLIAIGRKAVLNSPELDKLGIKYSPKGIDVDDFMKTNKGNIYAIGDATGKSILAHVAIQQGIITAENIMAPLGSRQRKMNYDVIPAVVYTLPEVASVGTVPNDLKDIQVVKFPFTSNLRANIEEHNKGFAKLWINKNSKTLVAVQIINDNAGEIVQIFAQIVQSRLSIEDVASTIHAHPTYSEIVRNSLEFALGRAIEHFE